MMKMVSYWSDFEELYLDKKEGMHAIFGKYNHKNKDKSGKGGEFCIGMYWDSADSNTSPYPMSHNTITPIALSIEASKIFLVGLIYKASLENNKDILKKASEALLVLD